MSVWLIILVYTAAVFGVSILFTKTLGPFNIFFRIRLWTAKVSDNLGYLFRCMTCFPTNVGWITALINWFLIPQVAFTPGNILFQGTNLWWAAMILDACYCAGAVHFIANIDDFIDKSTPIIEEIEEDEDGQ